MAASSQYIWSFQPAPFGPYPTTTQNGAPSSSAHRRPFQDIIDYEMPSDPGPSNFLQTEQSSFQLDPEPPSSVERGKRKEHEGDEHVEKPRVERRGGPRIPKGIEMFSSFQAAMEALKLVMVPTAVDVDFSANFLVENDPPVADRDRVKVLAHEIWRATGFRFTIKDHPQLKEGHKTRYWCARDEAGRSKSKGPASADSKIRYPCKSSLLVSCKCDDPDTPNIRLMTIRLHHHLPHSKETDAPSQPEIHVSWKSPSLKVYTHHSSQSASAPLNSFDEDPKSRVPKKRQRAPRATNASPYLGVSPSDGLLGRVRPPPPFLNLDKTAWKKTSVAAAATASAALTIPHEGATSGTPLDMEPMDHSMPMDVSPPPPPPPPPVPPPPSTAAPSSTMLLPSETLPPAVYQERMRTHIRNIREFCNGLEYQLQFNDQRMLSAVETEGKGFLELVHTCLEQEGRLQSGSAGADTITLH